VTPPRFRSVRIVRAPIGEAPDWVREAWIGLDLPLAHPHEISVETGGVLSGPWTTPGYWWAKLTRRLHQTTGWVVHSARAIDLLEATQPEAARWWRVNAPRFCEADGEFIFDSPACDASLDPIPGSPWG